MSAARGKRKPASDAVELFLDMMATERGASGNTLDAYRRDLDDYSGFLASKKRSVDAATTADIRAYLAALAKRDLASSSVARRLSAVRQLHRFLYAEGKRKDDPAAVLEGPRRGRPLPKILTVDQVSKLLATAQDAAARAEAKSAERVRASPL